MLRFSISASDKAADEVFAVEVVDLVDSFVDDFSLYDGVLDLIGGVVLKMLLLLFFLLFLLFLIFFSFLMVALLFLRLLRFLLNNRLGRFLFT